MFTTLPVSRNIEIINNENYPKLIQDIFNALSLFLNIGILDIVVYINRAPNLLLKLYLLLITNRKKLLFFATKLEFKSDMCDETGLSRTKSRIPQRVVAHLNLAQLTRHKSVQRKRRRSA